MFKKFRIKRLLRKSRNYQTYKEYLRSLSDKQLNLLAGEIIWSEYSGGDYSKYYSQQNYFNRRSRWQKEFFIEERKYVFMKFC